MSAFGPKRTSLVAPHMSAFGGKGHGFLRCECLLLTQNGRVNCSLLVVRTATMPRALNPTAIRTVSLQCRLCHVPGVNTTRLHGPATGPGAIASIDDAYRRKNSSSCA